ncbi:MAG: putative dna replication complex gins protein psf1 [Streblomastix strix]|uniref:Putative dna replication complex gins protein psf1 n=1 Tax=Streblomastix strix TaxID=222440 RepID=A0A5J4X399_9EUKA|nr:MAG: putative dna replication complex gins protein psf1 [Streblomastix strix]
MAQPGERGIALLRTLKQSAWLPPFDEEGVSHVRQEIIGLNNEAISWFHEHIEGKTPEIALEFVQKINADFCGIARNRRILLAYFEYRLQRIREAFWEVGVLSSSMNKKLNEHEKQYFFDYTNCVQDYCNELDTVYGIQITRNLNPPLEAQVQVRVVGDELIGKNIILPESGTLIPVRDGHYFLPLADVEEFIASGEMVQTAS